MIKVAAGTVEQDAARVRAIREAVGPDYPLIADANQGWDVLRAVRFARLVEDCGLALLEQPVPPDDIDGLAEVRRTAGLRLSADESVHTLAQARHLIEKKAVDVFSIKVIKHGGIRKAHAIMRYAEAHGILCLMNSNAEEGVTQAASLPTRRVDLQPLALRARLPLPTPPRGGHIHLLRSYPRRLGVPAEGTRPRRHAQARHAGTLPDPQAHHTKKLGHQPIPAPYRQRTGAE